MPSNTTRSDILPGRATFSRVAVAPWTSGACAKAYLSAAHREGASAFLFYLAKDVVLSNQTAAAPPNGNDAAWQIDGGLGWQSSLDFPVYAINANEGSLIMTELSLYSGNITQAPRADDLLAQYDARDSVRLYCNIDSDDSSELPSLWVFLLVVIGMLAAMVFVTSFGMHIIQRRRRRRIRELLSSGQVDLQSLGIQLLTVPRDVIESFPLSVYQPHGGIDHQAEPSSSNEPDEPSAKGHSIDSDPKADLGTSLPPASALSHLSPQFPQPTCHICLDDFVADETIVRSLPCHHIFHPACIDPLLSEYSTLCPVCKASALPARYCPRDITNSMVRQQRMSRGRRRTLDSRGAVTQAHQPFAAPEPAFSCIRGLFRRTGRPAESRNAQTDSSSDHELGQVSSRLGDDRVESNTEGMASAARPPSVPRSEWARHRASAFFGRHARAEAQQGGGPQSPPRCK